MSGTATSWASPRVLMLAGIGGWLMVKLLIFWWPLSFLFEGSFEKHQLWFRHGYVLSYIFFSALFPVVYGLWWWGMAQVMNIPGKRILVLLQTLTVIALQKHIGFAVVSDYGVVLLIIMGYFLVEPYATRMRLVPLLLKAAGGSFLFAGYIALCLALPRFHPFAKYAMFNKFPDVTYVYLLRNEHNELVPIEHYSKLKNDDLYAYSVFINERHGFAHGNNTEKRIEAQQMCNELMQIFLDNLKPNHPPFEMLTLYKTTFTLQHGKPEKAETPICTYVVE